MFQLFRLMRLLGVFLVFQHAFCLSSQAECKLDQLPPTLSNWIQIEQNRMARYFCSSSKKSATADPADSKLDYSPENGKIFPLKNYWIPKSKLQTFEGDGASSVMEILRQKTEPNSEPRYRLFVHPASEKFYQALTQGADEGDPFCATMTSSHRTLLVWKENGSVVPFLAKLSLDQNVGGYDRLIQTDEVTSSIGMNQVLISSQNSQPEDFSFFPEVFGLIPRNQKVGGMIIRLIPESVVQGKKVVIPLFSLYGQPKGGGDPFLVTMLKKSHTSARAFLTERLIRPFARQWVRLGLEQGFVPEAHGQNTMVEIDSDGLLNGKFMFRDLDGFALDLAYREKLGFKTPSLPFVESVEKEYGQTRKEKAYYVNHSIWWFNDVLNVIGFRVLDWMRTGLIPEEKLELGALEKIFLKELFLAWQEKMPSSGVRYLPTSVKEVSTWVNHAVRRALRDKPKTPEKGENDFSLFVNY